jgi:L,D-transpeptidase ErfK/SrfK
MGRAATLLALVLAMAAEAAAGPPDRKLPVYDLVAGGTHTYTIARGDSLWSITGRFTMNVDLLESLNAIPDRDHLAPGTELTVSDRHIVPRRGKDDVVIDLADRTVFWFAHGALKGRFPVGIGRIDWATPPGRYRIVGRRQDPVWRVPASIQAEMRARGEKVEPIVAAGPDNPLGRYWIQLSTPGYGLHGTNAPGSVGKYASHGCMRLLEEDIERLYREARDGTRVEVIYEPVKIARDAAGSILLEVHRDAYHGNRTDLATVLAGLQASGFAASVDWSRAAEVVARAWGTPEDVTLHPVPPDKPDLSVAATEP